ncbi:hypothetical protein ABT160_46520 [Streptomyces sp. NPDC001941]|uniref:hypothetical protein n=1 Tax=Streptomyces sp. NPDC001941 TaxID=3154659 RepID=UPI0033293DFF
MSRWEREEWDGAMARAVVEVRTGKVWDPWAVAVAAHVFLNPVGRARWEGRGEDRLDELLLPVVWASVHPSERAGYAAVLEAFTARHEERLERLFTEYGPASANATRGEGRYQVLGYPASLLILQRLSGVGSRAGPHAWWKREGLEVRWLQDAGQGWGVAGAVGSAKWSTWPSVTATRTSSVRPPRTAANPAASSAKARGTWTPEGSRSAQCTVTSGSREAAARRAVSCLPERD